MRPNHTEQPSRQDSPPFDQAAPFQFMTGTGTETGIGSGTGVGEYNMFEFTFHSPYPALPSYDRSSSSYLFPDMFVAAQQQPAVPSGRPGSTAPASAYEPSWESVFLSGPKATTAAEPQAQTWNFQQQPDLDSKPITAQTVDAQDTAGIPILSSVGILPFGPDMGFGTPVLGMAPLTNAGPEINIGNNGKLDAFSAPVTDLTDFSLPDPMLPWDDATATLTTTTAAPSPTRTSVTQTLDQVEVGQETLLFPNAFDPVSPLLRPHRNRRRSKAGGGAGPRRGSSGTSVQPRSLQDAAEVDQMLRPQVEIIEAEIADLDQKLDPNVILSTMDRTVNSIAALLRESAGVGNIVKRCECTVTLFSAYRRLLDAYARAIEKSVKLGFPTTPFAAAYQTLVIVSEQIGAEVQRTVVAAGRQPDLCAVLFTDVSAVQKRCAGLALEQVVQPVLVELTGQLDARMLSIWSTP